MLAKRQINNYNLKKNYKLQEYGVLSTGERIEDYTVIEKVFKNGMF